jgi:DNA helicase HerA-like ATPase
MLFDVSKTLTPRASIPFHIVLEEAHRYVQNDGDVNLLGYNIFERIAKEGRKYGILLGLITQRPSELSETVISQCNNFLIFKMTHPYDMDYIKKMIPFMSNEVSKQIQSIPPGYCYVFGTAFKLPMIVKVDMPDPTPISNNVNIQKVWY